MNTTNDFPMVVNIKQCHLVGDSIEEIKGLPVTSYNPFDYYSKGDKELYLQFVAVDENDPQDILKFISTYGFLGYKKDKNYIMGNVIQSLVDSKEATVEAVLDCVSHYIRESTVNPSIDPLGVIDYLKSEYGTKKIAKSEQPKVNVFNGPVTDFKELMINLPAESEKLSNIAIEIVTMRLLVLLWQALSTNHRENAISQMTTLYRIEYKDRPITVPLEEIIAELIDFDELNDAVVWHQASSLLSRWVNKKLSGVTPLLGKFTDNTSFLGLWSAQNLLSALYVMFYLDLTRGIGLRKCQNQTCKQFFSMNGADERKIYCGEGCAKSQAQREYRRRKKEQKLKESVAHMED